MDGTVNCASRDDGRPALAGTAAAGAAAATFSTATGVAVTGDLDLEGADVCTGLTDVLETDMGTGLATARGLEIAGFESDGLAFLAATALGGTAVLAAGLTVDFALPFATGLADFAAAPLNTGLAAGLDTGLTADLSTGLAAAFGVAFTTALALEAATTLATGLLGLLVLATGFPLGLTTAVGLCLAAALLSFPDLAFTSCLLAGIFCAWSMGPATPDLPMTGIFGWASPAREFTGFPLAKPNRCKIETIIWLSF